MDERHYLSPLFEPASIAVIGATERTGAPGAIVLHNLLDAGFPGALYAVNPKHSDVQGVPCVDSITDLPAGIDLAIITAPTHATLGVLEACIAMRTRCAVLISAAPSERGTVGNALPASLLEHARAAGLRIIGPESLGVARPARHLNATFATPRPEAGTIGFLSQSGALCAAAIDYARSHGAGFSAIAALGSSADLDFGEVLDYLAWDARTEAILVHLEGIRDARRFLSALRAAARIKPVFVLKTGRHAAGARAALAHSGARTGDDGVFDAALRRAGAIRLPSLNALFAMLGGLRPRRLPRGRRLALLTNGGGLGVIAADRAADLGLQLARLSPETIARIEKISRRPWSRDNPVDLGGECPPADYAQALLALLDDPEVDAVLCLCAPLAPARPDEAAWQVIQIARKATKPLLACWAGGEVMHAAQASLKAARIPVASSPETAIELFALLGAHHHAQHLLAQVPAPEANEKAPMRALARELVEGALASRRTVLHRSEALALLAAFHIPVPQVRVALSLEEAQDMALQLGYPVSLRLNSSPHGSRLGRASARHALGAPAALRTAWSELEAIQHSMRQLSVAAGVCVEKTWRSPCARELMVRIWRDPVFGPVIGCGERSLDRSYWPDRAVALPPLNGVLVRDLLAGTHAERMLGPLEGMPPADFEALEALLIRLSTLVCELPALRELEINPLALDNRGLFVADLRIEVSQPPASQGAYAHMAIHPYPHALRQQWALADGTPVTIRPIRPEDGQMNQNFVRNLSPQTRYFRYQAALRELTPAMLARLTLIDYDREMAFIATETAAGVETQTGVARFTTAPDGESCEFAIVVADARQHSGLGRRLMEAVIDAARARGLRWMKGRVLENNARMLAFVARLGFTVHADPEDKALRLCLLDLGRTPGA